MTTPAAAVRRSGPTNERVELARYTISAGERIVYGQRVLGIVRLTDVPADGAGRHYLIERGLTAIQLPGLHRLPPLHHVLRSRQRARVILVRSTSFRF